MKAFPTVMLTQGETFAVYVDVDSTLLLWPGKVTLSERDSVPVNWPLVNALKAWHKDGNVLVLWSRGGKAHCEFAARRCGLKPDACLPKPRICVDDSPRTVTAGEERRGFIVLPPDYFG